MKLKKLKEVGTWYGHFYKSGDDILFQECTQQEYESLKNLGSPNVLGEWISSGLFTKYDSLSGFVEDGTYADAGDNFEVKITGFPGCLLSKKDILQDELSDTTEVQKRSEGKT